MTREKSMLRMNRDVLRFGSVLLLMMWVLSACRPTLEPTPVGGGTGRITFSSFREGESQIYIMNADGSEQMRLVKTSGRAKQPVWSPDGSRIALIMSKIEEGHNLDLYVMESDGSNLIRLTESPSIESDPCWAPDGSRIAFVSSHDSFIDLERGPITVYNIFVIDSDGSNFAQLSIGEAQDLSPSWSPDGTRIAFHSNRDGNFDIFVMNADGSELVNLTHHPSDDQFPAWSPDGAQIAFTSDRDGNEEIYIMRADGTTIERLTDDIGRSKRPVWSPDGKLIAFYSDREGNFEIYVMANDGSGVTRLTDHLDFDGFPSWQP
jgi:Tol biopolymer transport system component